MIYLNVPKYTNTHLRERRRSVEQQTLKYKYIHAYRYMIYLNVHEFINTHLRERRRSVQQKTLKY